MSDRRNLLKNIPAIDKLLNSSTLQPLAATCPHVLLVEASQLAVEELRHQILNESAPEPDCTIESIAGARIFMANKLAEYLKNNF